VTAAIISDHAEAFKRETARFARRGFLSLFPGPVVALLISRRGTMYQGESVFEGASTVGKLQWLSRVLADRGAGDRPKLSAQARAIAAALVVRHNSESGRLDPGIADLAALAGCCRRKAQMARDELVAAGYLVEEERRAGARNLSNAYRLVGAAEIRRGARPRLAAVDGRQVEDREREARQVEDRPVETPIAASAEPELELEVPPPAAPIAASAEPARAPPPSAPPGGRLAPAQWRAIRALLEKAKGKAWSRAWLDPLEAGTVDAGGALRLEAPTRFIADWVRTREAGAILEAAERAGVALRSVRVEVAALPRAA
jgi:hypothetical protein